MKYKDLKRAKQILQFVSFGIFFSIFVVIKFASDIFSGELMYIIAATTFIFGSFFSSVAWALSELITYLIDKKTNSKADKAD